MDSKAVAEIRANDRRIAQVGNRKNGYCGHVPENIYFIKPMIPTFIHAPKMNVEPRPVPKVDNRPPTAPQDPLLARLMMPVECRRSTMGGTSASGKRHIPGYAGHKPLSPPAAATAAAAIADGLDLTGSFSGASNNKSNSPSRTQFPRYPYVRGPQRKSPIGFDVFLTN